MTHIHGRFALARSRLDDKKMEKKKISWKKEQQKKKRLTDRRFKGTLWRHAPLFSLLCISFLLSYTLLILIVGWLSETKGETVTSHEP